MPSDVGDAFVGYLNGGRPVVSCREVFLRRRAPLIGIDSTTVTTVVHFACRRAGLATMGAHRLRHALAAELLAAGAGLPEVAQLLRHRDLASTAVYAKVDRVSLGSLARPWPRSGS